MCYIPYCANQQNNKQNLAVLAKSEVKQLLKVNVT